MAITAWSAKVCDQLDLLVGERLRLRGGRRDRADRLAVPEHRDAEDVRQPPSSQRHQPDRSSRVGRHVGDVDGRSLERSAADERSRGQARSDRRGVALELGVDVR